MLKVDLVGGAVHLHVHHLGGSPPAVIRVSVTDLIVIYIRLGVAFYEIIVAPAYVVEYVVKLSAFLVFLAVFDYRPCQQRHGI